MKPSDISLLIVDDEQLILDTISELFKGYGFKVDCAISGNVAWEMLKNAKYNVVFSDIKMPDGDGIALIKRIKSTYKNSISVLFMSGFSDLQNEEIYHIGAEGKFAKPFNTQAVRTAIELSLMAPSQRWNSSLFKPDPKAVVIEKNGDDIKSLQEKKLALFGRGGFFLSHNYAPPAKGSMVRFSIKIEKPKRLEFVGHGIVRWIQVPGKTNIPPGVGIEIVQMDLEAGKTYIELFKDQIPYIPSFAQIAIKS